MIGTCRYCGKLLDHFYPDCGQQPSEAPQAGVAAGALPVVNEALSDIEQVSADLEECSSLDLNEWGDRVGEALEVIRAHLHHLTAERDALRGERDRLADALDHPWSQGAQIEVPLVPNFLRTTDGATMPLTAFADETLMEIAEAWKRNLLKRKAEMKANKDA